MMIRRSAKRGFTLVELMIVVAIIGVLAALAIYGVRRYMYTAKTAEAKTGVGRISKDASNAFNAETMPGTVLAIAGEAQKAHRLCAGEAATVPAVPPAGAKYQTAAAEWQVGKPAAGDADQRGSGFYCMGFNMQDPQMYSYGYTQGGNVDDATGTFTAVANGDLDGDGSPSTFSVDGALGVEGNELIVRLAPGIEEVDPLE
jgi:type IV pilus assembly protein PilA